jgi:hypothetical protein
MSGSRQYANMALSAVQVFRMPAPPEPRGMNTSMKTRLMSLASTTRRWHGRTSRQLRLRTHLFSRPYGESSGVPSLSAVGPVTARSRDAEPLCKMLDPACCRKPTSASLSCVATPRRSSRTTAPANRGATGRRAARPRRIRLSGLLRGLSKRRGNACRRTVQEYPRRPLDSAP